jgi:hypothetical protein
LYSSDDTSGGLGRENACTTSGASHAAGYGIGGKAPPQR